MTTERKGHTRRCRHAAAVTAADDHAVDVDDDSVDVDGPKYGAG